MIKSEASDYESMINVELSARCINLHSAPDVCDALVVGAGPAGAFLAAELARAGKTVLLCEKTEFPRHKICGCCLGFAAVSILNQSGARVILDRIPSVSLTRVRCLFEGEQLTLPIKPGRALSRSLLDSALVLYGVEQGLLFLPNTTARLEHVEKDFAMIQLCEPGGQKKLVRTKILVAADGIGGSALSHFSRFAFEVRPDSRVGIGCIIESHQVVEPGTINMYYNPRGYLGAVSLEDGRTNLAAAVDAQILKDFGAGRTVAKILSGFASTRNWRSYAADQHWRGTVALSRKRKNVWGERVFVVGDAGGYLEPFTGEGMSAALASAKIVLPLVLSSIEEWQPSLGMRWQTLHRSHGTSDRFICKAATAILRKPKLVTATASVLENYPGMWTRVASLVNKPYCEGLQ